MYSWIINTNTATNTNMNTLKISGVVIVTERLLSMNDPIITTLNQ
jgi:hypothetical protein